VPAGLVVVGDDAEARRIVEAARRAGESIPPLGLVGGDLARTLGARGGPDRFAALGAADPVRSAGGDGPAGAGGPDDAGDGPAGAGGPDDAGNGPAGNVVRMPVDLGSVLVDGRQHWFVAHLVARRSWWRGRIVAAMNAEFVGDWDVAPRSHPNDGRLDVLDVAASMPLADRVRARGRLAQGTHVPHPAIRQSRVPAVQVDLDGPTPVWLDGERVASAARHLSVRIEPDALTCVV
jgi:hypothetical protein